MNRSGAIAMQGDGKKRLWTLPLLLGAGVMASAVAEENAERSKEGFIEGSGPVSNFVFGA
nr:hypothetical protein [Pseudomonas aeruginosa]